MCISTASRRHPAATSITSFLVSADWPDGEEDIFCLFSRGSSVGVTLVSAVEEEEGTAQEHDDEDEDKDEEEDEECRASNRSRIRCFFNTLTRSSGYSIPRAKLFPRSKEYNNSSKDETIQQKPRHRIQDCSFFLFARETKLINEIT